MFKRLQLLNFRQFERIDIQFHPSVTVLTGANGSGKTTLLNLLARHFGWAIPFAATPVRERSGILGFFSGLLRKLISEPRSSYEIGFIEYSNGAKASLTVPDRVGSSFNVDINGQQQVPGVHIPSHRPVYFYQGISSIPTRPKTRSEVGGEYSSQVRDRYLGGGSRLAIYSLKENLIALAVYGYGNQAVVPDTAARETFEGFQDALCKILPASLGFRRFRIEIPEIVLECETGDFALDAVSGGVAALIDLTWQIFMFAKDIPACAITIDEPESHLHPKMQRRILPDLVSAFSNCQFIVATHNPLVVSSVDRSNVYVLDYNSNRRVESTYLDMLSKAKSSNDILRDVLGLDFTMPIWVEQRLADITTKYLSRELDESALKAFREEMEALGFAHLLPQTAAKLFEREARR